MAIVRINHLGPIQRMDLEINRFNLFIGEQATGKSTICKAVYYFRNFKEILLEYLYNIILTGKEENVFPKALNFQMKDAFIKLFGYSWELPDDLYIQYDFTEECFVKVCLKKEKKKYLSVEYSPHLTDQIKLIEREAINYYNDCSVDDSISSQIIVEKRKFFAGLREKVFSLLEDDMMTYYIPAGRSMLSLLMNQKTKLNYDDLEPLNRIFIQRIESLQPKFANGVTQAHNFYPTGSRKFDVGKVSDEIIKSVKGEYFYQGSKEYLLMKDTNEQVPINYTSSGQQEILWLYNELYALMLKDEKAFVIIEEPEAHIYPSLQKNILDFITFYFNLTGGSVIVTTHSPYILTECNNLCYAGRLKKKSGLENGVEKIAGKWNYLDADVTNASKLKQTMKGTEIISLIDEETGELMAEKIDEISKEINQVYTGLFYLEEGL